MNLDYVKSWISQPDVCRCCLAAAGSYDMTGVYVSDAGVKEVYYDMIQQCFGISLSHVSEWGPSRLVCTLCVAQLRLACAFKKQVLQSERQFDLYYSDQIESATINKTDEETQMLETTTVEVKSENFKKLPHPSYRNKEPLSIKPNSIRKCTRKKRKILKSTQRTEIKVIDTEYDSDTPIAKLAKVISFKEEIGDDGNKIDRSNSEIGIMENNNIKDNIKSKGQKYVRSRITTKPISERKRVILTCGTVLRDTTACPFRHHKSWFQCFFCFQDFMEINPLRVHTLNAHADVDGELKKIKRYPRSLQIDISNLQCRHCRLTLTDVSAMRRHFVDVHNKIIYNECIADYKVDSSPYTCHICKQEFHVFRTLTTHLNEHYANCICDVCGKSFLNTKRLKVHKRTHESGNYPCNECGKVLTTKTSRANHIESAHSKRIIKCQICLKPMKHYNDRIKHMSEDHNITHKFKCPICSREYNIKHYLATHIRQTHGHKNKKCTECDMAFITNNGLKKHMIKHTGEKPFTCGVCCKSYARSYTLREHMRAHNIDQRPLRH